MSTTINYRGLEEKRTHLHFFKTTRSIILLRVRSKFSRLIDLDGYVGGSLHENREIKFLN